MKKLLLFCVFVILTTVLRAQFAPDTIFYTSRWQPTHDMDSVVYYRVAEKAGDVFVVTDYYKSSGMVQMRGTCLSIHPDIKHGAFTYYYADGKIQSARNYLNNKSEGAVTWYYPNGIAETTGSFKEDKRHGEWKWYTEKGDLRMIETYENGVLNGVVKGYTERGKLEFEHYYAQGKKAYTRYYEQDLRSGLLVRGKAAGFVIIEDIWVLNITAGLEYRFKENHAVGIEYYFFRWRYEQEQYITSTNYEEYSEYNPRHSVLADYRYYFDANFSKSRGLVPYFQLYGRVGKARIYHDAEYQIDSAGVFRQWEKFYDVGATFGLHYGFLPEGRFGFDICAGAARRAKLEDVEYYDPGGQNWFAYDQPKTQWFPVLRINLFYYLFKRKQTEI